MEQQKETRIFTEYEKAFLKAYERRTDTLILIANKLEKISEEVKLFRKSYFRNILSDDY